MSTTLFKLTGPPPDGLTRRVAFFGHPSWDELSAKIEAIYGIPHATVCVSYEDSDGDEVTLSSNEELQDYFRFNLKPNEPGNDAIKAIRFLVRDLAQHDANKPLPQTPHSSNYRNTFGTSAFGSVHYGDPEDSDWQSIPMFSNQVFVPFDAEEDAPHAYVETVNSEASLSKENLERETLSDDNQSTSTITESAEHGSKTDKGKRRATVEEIPDIDSAPSAVSMVNAETPDKMPIHVKQGSQAGTEDTFGVRNAPPIIISSPATTRTSKVEETAESIKSEVAEPVTKVEEKTEQSTAEQSTEAPDPPLPEFDDIPAPPANVSFANDIAALLNSFSSVFAAHPELAEGMRNIVRSATNGTYWAAHRDSVTRAAEDLRRGAQQSAEDFRRGAQQGAEEIRRGAEQGAEEVRRAAEAAHRAAEEAAGRRVADALGGVMRVFSELTGYTAPLPGAAPGEPVTSTPARHDVGPRRSQVLHRRATSPAPRRWHGADSPRTHVDPFMHHHHHHHGSVNRFTHHGPPHHPVPPPHMPGGLYSHPPPPPPGPPPAGPHPPPPPPGPFPPPPPHGAHRPPPPPPNGSIPPPPPPFPHFSWDAVPPPPTLNWGPPPMSIPPFSWGMGYSRNGPGPNAPPMDTSFSMGGVSASTPSREPSGSTAPEAETSMFTAIPVSPAIDESKARLEAAKEAYKAEKERYRVEREARRAAERERRRNISSESTRPLLPDHKEGEATKDGPAETTPAAKVSSADATPMPGAFPPPSTTTPVRPPSATPQMVSAARGPFPQLELVPRRSNTMHGTGHFRSPSGPPPMFHARPHTRPENPFLSMSGPNRAAQNITRRLADMGFTAEKFPVLPAKVNARVRNVAAGMSKETEDAAVQDVLEELLSLPAAKPATAGLQRSQTMGAPSTSK